MLPVARFYDSQLPAAIKGEDKNDDSKNRYQERNAASSDDEERWSCEGEGRTEGGHGRDRGQAVDQDIEDGRGGSVSGSPRPGHGR